MQVSDIIAHKGDRVVTAPPHAPVAEISQTLQDSRIGAVLVRDDGDELVGILSERDIVRSIAQQGPSALDLPAHKLMSSPVLTCTPDTDIEVLMQNMLEGRVRHLPVVEDGTLLGIVSIGDVVKGVVQELKWVKNALRDQVVQSAAWSTDED